MSKFFSGRVLSVMFDNVDSAFYIIRMVLDTTSPDKTKKGVTVTVKGNVPGITITVGAWFGFEADWVNHPKFGRQLSITRAPMLKDGWDPDTASRVLVANGVGGQIMRSIRSHVGDEALLDALGDPALLEAVPGIAKFSALHVASRWEVVQANFKTLAYLADMGVPAGLVKDIWSHFGDDAEKVLSKNPWALVEVDGITFAHADEVARRNGLSTSDARIRGAVLYVCKSNRSFGHLYLRTGSILHSVNRIMEGANKKSIVAALVSLHNEGLIVIDKKTRQGTTAIYEPWAYEMEKGSADLLVARNKSAAYLPADNRTMKYLKDLGSVGPATEDAAKAGHDDEGLLEHVVRVAIDEWGSQAQLVLSDEQKVGIFNALTAPVSILAGLPGTGKTTSLKAAVRILQDAGVPFLLCAPTGIAAKNLSARTGAAASTIHRAFSAKGISDNKRASTYAGIVGASSSTVGVGDGVWGYSQDNPHTADVIIIDEASMVDQHLMFRLLDCTKPTARLVFVGDYAQLPSVGPGNVLRDLIASKMFPTIKLEQIFRQDDTSGIVFAAHAMHRGKVPDSSKDFRLIKIRDEDDVLDAVLKIGQKFYDKRYNFQILSPKHGGAVGVTNINERLRELLNPRSPGQTEHKIGGHTMREGDRIMIVKNDYKLGVFNGDVGKISRVDKSKKALQVKIFGQPPLFVNIEFNVASKLIRLAYACTVHKAQGLEYDRVVMPLVDGFYHQLQRNLVYTAITRAKVQVVLVGHRSALVKAVHNAKENDRATLFLDRIAGLPSE